VVQGPRRPVRLRLLSLIASHEGGEACVCELTVGFEVSGPTISHHLKVLCETGLIEGDRRGTWIYYRVGLQLLENSMATMFGLAVLILLFGPVSGAHFNPVVSAVDWLLGRRTHTGLSGRDVWGYTAAQVIGAVAGAVLANVMFGLAAIEMSHKPRSGVGLWVAESWSPPSA
jgi:glycerol uptake facilitator-like aquaporin